MWNEDNQTIKDQNEGVFLSTASSFCNFSTSTDLSFMTYQLDCKLCSSAIQTDIEHRGMGHRVSGCADIPFLVPGAN